MCIIYIALAYFVFFLHFWRHIAFFLCVKNVHMFVHDTSRRDRDDVASTSSSYPLLRSSSFRSDLTRRRGAASTSDVVAERLHINIINMLRSSRYSRR